MVLSLDRWRGKVAIVTGASSGIGAAIAEKLVEEGLLVVGFARRLDRMQEMEKKLNGKKGKFYPVKCDVSKEVEVLDAFRYVIEKIGHVHVLVNNAGLGLPGNLRDGETDTWNTVFSVNVLGLCVATREAIKDMDKHGVDGHIIHINSVAGHFIPTFPGINVYSATKHAVTVLAETLRNEMARVKRKIKITSVSPGLVNTEIIGVSGFDKTMKIDQMPSLSSENIADCVAYVLSTPPEVDISELTIRPVNEVLP